MSRHRIAILGLGMALTPHARSLADLADRVEAAGAWSRSEERCRAAAEATGLSTTTDLDALLADPSVDVVFVLTPPFTHLDLAERCLAAGKHVLLEKPLEISLDRAERVVAAAAEADRRLGVVLQHRFRRSAGALWEALQAGRLGRIAAATCTVPWWRPQSYYDEPGRGTYERDGGGVLMTQAIHTLDLFRALTGGVERVAAVSATTARHAMEAEDFVSAALVLAGGVPGNLMATTAAYPGFADGILLVCEKGTAELSGGALTITYADGTLEEVQDGTALGSGGDPMDFPHDAHRALIADFLDAVEGACAATVSGTEALRTQYLIQALLDSAAETSWRDVTVR